MSTTDEAPTTWLTQGAHDRLKAELDQLIANRSAVAQEIHSRREEGDLKENGGYHAAKEEQGKQEARIRQLGDLLRTATVGDPPQTADAVAPGVVVTVQFDDDAEDTETFLLGSREIAATTDITVYSPESALGAAILGHKVGETVSYATPAGASISATVVELQPFRG
ncbi:MAG TPA: transcription elongation factor GreA [Cryptosporangiaceae bacterium]|nr:transcription elongation factor GreA [Cryptosporangiaceae bacterium]